MGLVTMQVNRRWVIGAAAIVAVGCYLLMGSRTVIQQQGDRPDERRATASAPSAASPLLLPPPPLPVAPTHFATDAGVQATASGSPAGNIPPEILEIRAAVVNEPVLAEQLIYADRERAPDSPFSDERDALLVSAVHNQRRRWDAKAEARRYFRAHPNGKFTDFITRTTGVQPD